jgi:hypothetical protein
MSSWKEENTESCRAGKKKGCLAPNWKMKDELWVNPTVFSGLLLLNLVVQEPFPWGMGREENRQRQDSKGEEGEMEGGERGRESGLGAVIG